MTKMKNKVLDVINAFFCTAEDEPEEPFFMDDLAKNLLAEAIIERLNKE